MSEQVWVIGLEHMYDTDVSKMDIAKREKKAPSDEKESRVKWDDAAENVVTEDGYMMGWKLYRKREMRREKGVGKLDERRKDQKKKRLGA